MRQTKINIIGDGSIGHLWAAHFFKRQIDFNLFGRTAKPMQSYQLTSPNENFFYKISVSSMQALRSSNLTIICVKAHSLNTLCEQLKRSELRPATIVLMMNGMGLIEIVKKILPNASIYQASITHGANLSGARLKYTGTGTTLIGAFEHSSDQKHSLMRSLIPLLNQALPGTVWNDDQFTALWTKLLINSIINPLTALYRVRNGAIVDDPNIRSHAMQLTQELAPLIDRYLPGQSWQSIFEQIISVCDLTSDNQSSMLKDIMANRATEIEFITGYIMTKAEHLGCELIAHRELNEQMRTTRDKFHQ